MKLNNMIKCPKCESLKTYQYQHTDVSLWDDEFNESLEIKDSIIYKSKCKDCGNYFNVKVVLKCEIVSYKTF